MRRIDVYKTTGDSRVYRMMRRRYTLRCSRCKPHRRDNINYHDFRRRSWKEYRETQYK